MLMRTDRIFPLEPHEPYAEAWPVDGSPPIGHEEFLFDPHVSAL